MELRPCHPSLPLQVGTLAEGFREFGGSRSFVRAVFEEFRLALAFSVSTLRQSNQDNKQPEWGDGVRFAWTGRMEFMDTKPRVAQILMTSSPARTSSTRDPSLSSVLQGLRRVPEQDGKICSVTVASNHSNRVQVIRLPLLCLAL